MSICEGNGIITWWSNEGPMLWDKASEPINISDSVITQLALDGYIYLNRADKARSVYDPVNKRFLYKLDQYAAEFTNKGYSIIPYSLTHKTWESIAWDFGVVNSLCNGPSSVGDYSVYFGTSLKRVMEHNERYYTDAAQNQTGANLFFPITSASSNTAVFTYASTVPANPTGSYCWVLNKDTLEVHRSAYTITGSTTKTATLTTAFTTVPAAGSIITFDLPVLVYETKLFTIDQPLMQKRYIFAYLRIAANGDNSSLLGIKINNATTCSRAWAPVLKSATHQDPTQSPPAISG
jgi:hypothetical protein